MDDPYVLEMPFESMDVARVARQVAAKPRRLTTFLFGLNPAGLSSLMRRLWLAFNAKSERLATVERDNETVRREMLHWKYEYQNLVATQRMVTTQLDRVIATFGTRRSGVLIISPDQMRRLEDEYVCPDKKRASGNQRWAYTYKGHRVFTAVNIAGPVMLETAIFEGFKLALGTQTTLREM